MEKLETQNRRLELMGFAKPSKTHRLTGTGPGLAWQEAASYIFELFWNRTEPVLWSESGPLVGQPDLLPTRMLNEWFQYDMSIV